jgi:hypothetical protein
MGDEKQSRLTPEELASIKDQLLESIYADIGKSVVRKTLWITGAILFALYAWLRAHGFDWTSHA